jgi:hypothetical protein
MDLNFNDLIDILDGEEFEERPVDLQTFVTNPNYLAKVLAKTTAQQLQQLILCICYYA